MLPVGEQVSKRYTVGGMIGWISIKEALQNLPSGMALKLSAEYFVKVATT